MKRIQEYVLRLQVWRDTGGQDLVEYALTALLAGLPALRLDPAGQAAILGLVFRKPPRLDVLWR